MLLALLFIDELFHNVPFISLAQSDSYWMLYFFQNSSDRKNSYSPNTIKMAIKVLVIDVESLTSCGKAILMQMLLCVVMF